jgi:uncharacterized protein
MNAALILAGLAMGAAASPHCALMCGAACASLTGGNARHAAIFQAGRLAGYAAGGAVAAASVQWLGAWSTALPALRPLWVLLHLGFLALGLWWLITGRPLASMSRDGAVPVAIVRRGDRKAWCRSLAGFAWVAWPCGVLQAALMLAAMAGDASGGAMVMAVFALGSMPALALGPWLWNRWRQAAGTAATSAAWPVIGQRIAGLGLVAGSVAALGHGMWQTLGAWCGF